MRRSTRPPTFPAVLLATGVLALAPPSHAHAQDRGGVAVPRSDTRWSGWSRAALFLGGLVLLDEPTRDGAHGLGSGVGDAAAEAGRWLGDWKRSAPFVTVGVLALASHGDDVPRGLRRGAAALFGILSGSMANEALNMAVGRGRPGEELGPWRFDPFAGHASFPSGHTAYAFAIAGAVAEVTDGWWPAAVAYGAATLTGLSRLYHDRHWLSDVAAGAFVGAWAGARATRLALEAFGLDDPREGRENPDRHGWLSRIEPVVSAGFVGVRFAH